MGVEVKRFLIILEVLTLLLAFVTGLVLGNAKVLGNAAVMAKDDLVLAIVAIGLIFLCHIIGLVIALKLKLQVFPKPYQPAR